MADSRPTPTRAHRERALDVHYNGKIEQAPAWLHHWVETGEVGPGAADGKPMRIAQALADERGQHCVIGAECSQHNASVHGQEAERLRSGIQEALNGPPEWLDSELRGLLEQVDACDSLAFLEAK